MSTGLTYVDAPDVDTIDAEFARIVAELGAGDRIVVSATSADTLRAAARAMPEIPRALILGKTPDDLVAQASAAGATWLAPGIARLTPRHMAECAAAGISVDAWPANSEEQMRRCMALRVQAVTSDDPAAARPLCAAACGGTDEAPAVANRAALRLASPQRFVAVGALEDDGPGSAARNWRKCSRVVASGAYFRPWSTIFCARSGRPASSASAPIW